MIHLRGVLEVLSCVNPVFFLEDGLDVQVLKDLSAAARLKFSVKHQFDVVDVLEFFEETSDGPAREPEEEAWPHTGQVVEDLGPHTFEGIVKEFKIVVVLFREDHYKVGDLEGDDDDVRGNLLFFLGLAQLPPHFLFAPRRLVGAKDNEEEENGEKGGHEVQFLLLLLLHL